jgi:hypothetical protein
LKALFDDSDRPRERFVIVNVTRAERSISEAAPKSGPSKLAIAQMDPPEPSDKAADETSRDLYDVTIDIIPPALSGEPSAQELADEAVEAFGSVAGYLKVADASAGAAVIDANYTRYAVTSFETCLANTCLAGDHCIEGHSGPLCTVCLPGYGKTSVFKCARCSEPAMAYFVLVAGVVAAIAGCAILAWKQIVDGRQSMNELPAPAVPLLFKIAMSGLQVMSIAARYDLRWPGFLGDMFDGADSAAGVGTAIVSLDCFLGSNPPISPFWVTSIGIMVLPLFGVLLPVLFFTPRYYIAKRAYKNIVLAEILEQRRLLVEMVCDFESFQRNRDRTQQQKLRRKRAEESDAALNAVVWENVDDKSDLGVLASENARTRVIVHETELHADIDLNIKDSAQAEVAYAKRVYAKRRQNVHKSVISDAIVVDAGKPSRKPLAPPEQPPQPGEPSVWRASVSSGSRSRKTSFSAFTPPLPVRMLSSISLSTQPGIEIENAFDPSPHHSPSLTAQRFSGGRMSAFAGVMHRHRLAQMASQPDSAACDEPSTVYSYVDMENRISQSFGDVLAGGAPDSERDAPHHDSGEDSELPFHRHYAIDSDDERDESVTVPAPSAAAMSRSAEEGAVQSHHGFPAAPTLPEPETNQESTLSAQSKLSSSVAVPSVSDAIPLGDLELDTDKSKRRTHASSVFAANPDLLEELAITESALLHAYISSQEGRDAVFCRSAREVEVYAEIANATTSFDLKATELARANAITTGAMAKIVQTCEDLENMRVLSKQSFEMLYEAELLRERVLRRERALLHERTEKQQAWYLDTYGPSTGKEMFEAEQEKRRGAEPPKLTASEMRVRLDVAETRYNQVSSEYLGYIITTITVVMFMIHPNIVRQFFTVLSCKNIGGSDDPSASVVLGDMLEPCFSSQHLFFIAVLGVPMLVFWVLGIPVFAWYVLFRNRTLILLPVSGVSSVMRNRKIVFESQMAFLYRGYKPTRYYWFLAEMARKAALVAIAVFFPGALHTQLLMASLLIFACILAQIAAQPFENKIPEFAEFFSLFTSFMVFFLANFLFVDTVDDSSKVVVTVFICLLVIVFCAAIVGSFILLTKEESRLSPLRTALREAHAMGMDTAVVIRDWRIRDANARRARKELRRKTRVQPAAGAAAVAAAAAAVTQNDSASASDVAGLFTLTGGRGTKTAASASALRAMRSDAVDSNALSSSALWLVAPDSVAQPVATTAQRSVILASCLNAGGEVKAAFEGANGIDDADEAKRAIIRDAAASAAAARRVGAEALTVDLSRARRLSSDGVFRLDG